MRTTRKISDAVDLLYEKNDITSGEMLIELSQASNNAVTTTFFKNTTGKTLTFVRSVAGYYYAEIPSENFEDIFMEGVHKNSTFETSKKLVITTDDNYKFHFYLEEDSGMYLSLRVYNAIDELEDLKLAIGENRKLMFPKFYLKYSE